MSSNSDAALFFFSLLRARTPPFQTMEKLYDLANAAGLKDKINAMFEGEHINSTEDRAVLHVATRAPRDKVINVDGKNVVPQVWDVLDKIKDFTDKVRDGEWVGATGKPLTSVVAVGIGGSFLGPLFVHTSLRTCPEAAEGARGRQLRFLANVDPVDVARSLNGLDPETTLVVVVSKTFTTAEARSTTPVPIRPRRRGARRSLRTFFCRRVFLPAQGPSRSIPTHLRDAFQHQLTPLNSTPTFARMDNYPYRRCSTRAP
jgi:hypothetical protein